MTVPNQNAVRSPPGWWSFSCSQPNRIIALFAANSPMTAARSHMPDSVAIRINMTEALIAYSTQRAMFMP